MNLFHFFQFSDITLTGWASESFKKFFSFSQDFSNRNEGFIIMFHALLFYSKRIKLHEIYLQLIILRSRLQCQTEFSLVLILFHLQYCNWINRKIYFYFESLFCIVKENNISLLSLKLNCTNEELSSLCICKAHVTCVFKAHVTCVFKAHVTCVFKAHAICVFKAHATCVFKAHAFCVFKAHVTCVFKAHAICVFKAHATCVFKAHVTCVFKALMSSYYSERNWWRISMTFPSAIESISTLLITLESIAGSKENKKERQLLWWLFQWKYIVWWINWEKDINTPCNYFWKLKLNLEKFVFTVMQQLLLQNIHVFQL